MGYKDKEIIVKINKIGQKSTPQFKCTKSLAGRDKSGGRLIEVQNIKTKEIKISNYNFIVRSGNPFTRRSEDQLLKDINEFGMNSTPAFKCINTKAGKDKRGFRLVKVECLSTKEQKTVLATAILSQKSNPFIKAGELHKIPNSIVIDKINKIGSKSNIKFICTNPEHSVNKHNHRMIEVQNIETKEKLIRDYNSVRRGNNPFHPRFNTKSEASIQEEVNLMGKKNNPQYICTNPLFKRSSNKMRYVEIMCVENKEKKVYQFNKLKHQNPFLRSNFINEKIISQINACGKKTKGPKFVFLEFINDKKNRKALVQCVETKQKMSIQVNNLLKGVNPFKFGKLYDNNIMKTLNAIGSKAKHKFKCLDPKIIIDEARYVKVQCLTTNQIKICKYYEIRQSGNPFSVGKARDLEIVKEISTLGKSKKVQEKYVCIKSFTKKHQYGSTRYVKIKNIKTRELKTLPYHDLTRYPDYFNINRNQIELKKVHPQAIKLAKKLGFKIEKNYKLGRKSILDLRLLHPKLNFTIGTELKQSELFHHYSKKQKSRYTSKSKLKQHNMKHIFFVDPKGNHERHGFISFQDWNKKLKNLIKSKGLT